jgi:Holliday junction resolvase RusA-like endonuclease
VTVATVYRTICPCVPDADLSPNARVHWRVRARKVKALREFVYWATKADAPIEPFTGPVVLTISVGWPVGRKRHDDDNMVSLCKTIVDGMTDAGWFVNDSQVSIERPIKQEPWGRWKEQGGWLYPSGVLVIDCYQGDNYEDENPRAAQTAVGVVPHLT